MKTGTPTAHAATALTLVALLYTGTTPAAPATDTERNTHSELHCGPAILRATTTRLILDDDTPSQVLKQTLTLQTAEGKILHLPLDGKPKRKTLAQGRTVLDAELTSWTCLNQGKHRPTCCWPIPAPLAKNSATATVHTKNGAAYSPPVDSI